jgi:hypothetical protein
VVRVGVGEHAHRGLHVPGEADVVEDRLVTPHFSILPHVLAVETVRDPRLQVRWSGGSSGRGVSSLGMLGERGEWGGEELVIGRHFCHVFKIYYSSAVARAFH